MNNILEHVALQFDSIFIIFFKHLFREDQNKIEKGLGRTHYEVLRALTVAEKDNETVSLGDISKRLLVSKAYTTALTDRLIKNRLIKRMPHKGDRRVTNIVLTDTGRSFLQKKSGEDRETYKKRLSCLTDDDLKTLSRALEDIKEILSKISIED